MRRIDRSSAATCLVLGLALWAHASVRGQDTGTGGSGTGGSAPALARYAAREGLLGLFEFDGLKQHEQAWRQSAAYQVLNQTTTGDMLAAMLSDAVDRMRTDNPDMRLNGASVVSLVTSVAEHGMAAALVRRPGQGAGDEPARVFVLRNGARKDMRPVYARLLAAWMAPPAKPEEESRGGRTVIRVTGTPRAWSWWTEGDDLLVVFGESADVDLVLDVIDARQPSATEHPLRQELAASDGQFQGVARGFLDASQVPPLGADAPAGMKELGFGSMRHLDGRWGFEGSAAMSVVRIVAPGTRQGMLGLFDQPRFSLADIPPIPASIQNLRILSMEPLSVYQKVLAWLETVDGPVAARVKAFEQRLGERTRRPLREQVLGLLGPRVAIYEIPGGPANSNVGLIPNGLNVPQYVALIEIKDSAEFGKSMDELIIQINQGIAEQFNALLPPAAASDAAEGGRGERAPQRPDPPKFERRSATARFFVLKLPPQLAAITNLQLTIAQGEKYLAIATTASAAQNAIQMEQRPDEVWRPGGVVAGQLAGVGNDLVYVQVQDLTRSLPEALAQLPTTYNVLIAQVEAAARGEAPPGAGILPGGLAAAGPGGNRSLRVDDSSSSEDGSSSDDSGSSEDDGSGGNSSPSGGDRSSSDSSSDSDSGSGGEMSLNKSFSSGAAGNQAGGDASAPGLDAVVPPDANQVRSFLFPGTTVVRVDSDQIEFVSRTAFPNIANPGSAGIMVGLLLPAIQGAREAARRASGAGPDAAGGPGR